MKLLGRIAGVVAGIMTVSCTDSPTFPVGTPPRGVVTTDSLGYTARVVGTYFEHNIYQFRIITRYENTTTLPVIMLPCTDGSPRPTFSIIRTDGDPRTAAYNPGWACTAVLQSSLIVVAPGATRTDTFTLRGPTAFDGNTHEPLGVVTEGRFRFQYTAGWNCPSEGACAMPDSLWKSNEFVVRVER